MIVMKNSLSLLYSFILLVSDFLALTLAFALAYVIRVKIDDRPLLEPITAYGYIGVVAVLLIFWLVIYGLLGLYRTQVHDNRFKEFAMLLVGSFIGILFLIGAEYVLGRAIFPARLVTAYGFLFAFLLTLLFRTIIRAVRQVLRRRGYGVVSVLLVGTTDITAELAHKLNQPHNGFRVIGVVGDRRKNIAHVDPDIQYRDFAVASKYLKTNQIHMIMQTELFTDDVRNDEILAFAQEHHIAYRFIPSNSRLFVGSLEVNLFEGIPTVTVHQTALTGWGRVLKRGFDLVVSGFSLILLSPLFLLIAIIMKLYDRKSSILFTQARMTRFNREFKIYKFRTQQQKYDGTTPEEAFKLMGKPELAKEYRANGDFLEKDPRVTSIGRFLRKTSLDELPQIYNVWRGELSLVGPRPLIPEEIKLFNKRSVILSVKPGITGLAVVSGRKDIPFEERRKLDMYYAQNWSFLLDIVILLRTAVHVIGRSFKGGAD